MKSTTNFTMTIDLPDGKLDTILMYLKTLIPEIVTGILRQVVLAFAETVRSQEPCPHCQAVGKAHWKTHHGEMTSITTVYGKCLLNQLQLQCGACGHKYYITRTILGLERRQRTSQQVTRAFALIGALSTYRVAEKIASLCGVVLNRMQTWRCVQKVGSSIQFKLDPAELNEAEADGTGMPVRGSGKRGRELKVLAQRLGSGGVRIAGLAIGAYNGGWDVLFKPVLAEIKAFARFLLITDGDTSILDPVKDILTVKFQRCLWHIPHQLKFCLWQDKVKRKSADWKGILSRIYSIVSSRSLLGESDGVIAATVQERLVQLDTLVDDCACKGYTHCAAYLTNAREDLFTSLLNRFSGKTSSHAERVMRCANMRSNVGGTWTEAGCLNVNKVRLAYYYNGFDIDSGSVA